MPRFIDISVPIVSTPKKAEVHPAKGPHVVYKPGALDTEISTIVGYDTPGADRLASRINAPVHAGTHVDAPLHRDPNGLGIDQIPIERFIGELYVIDISHKAPRGAISAADLEGGAPTKGKMERLLVRTGWYKKLGTPEYDSPNTPHFTPDGVDWLLSRGVKLLVIDFRVDRFEDEALPLHKKLLSSGVCLVTNLANLDEIKKDKVTLYAFPVKIKGVEAAMTRAVVFED